MTASRMLGPAGDCELPGHIFLKLQTVKDLERSARLVYEVMIPTPQLCWPKLPQRPQGAGAAALAAALKESETSEGRRSAVVLIGGNVDKAVLSRVLTEVSD